MSFSFKNWYELQIAQIFLDHVAVSNMLYVQSSSLYFGKMASLTSPGWKHQVSMDLHEFSCLRRLKRNDAPTSWTANLTFQKNTELPSPMPSSWRFSKLIEQCQGLGTWKSFIRWWVFKDMFMFIQNQLMANWWFGFVGSQYWKGVLLWGTPIRIPNHWAPNFKCSISWPKIGRMICSKMFQNGLAGKNRQYPHDGSMGLVYFPTWKP